MRFLLTSFLFVVVLFSCKKDPIQYTVKGSIYDNSTTSSLPGVKVRVFQKPFSNSVTSSSFELIGSGTTDNSGEYSITFDRKKATEFKVTLEKEGYFDEEILLSSDYFTSETDNYIHYGMDGRSWISMSIENVAPAQQSDNLTLTWYTYRMGCAGCIENEFNSFNGVVDTTFVHENTAGNYLKFLYNNGIQSTIDSVYMPLNDTVSYSITY